MKISVIDLGFNSAKLVIYNVKDDDSFDVYQQEGIKVRLGEGLDEKGKLAKKPMSRTIDTLKVFRDIIQLNPIKSVLPIATSAVREARNKSEFLSCVSKETGFNFKVLSEREEALYSYVGAIKALQIPNVLFFDIGGGSLEIVHAEQFKIKKVISLPLGSLRLTQQFGDKKGKLTDKGVKNLQRYIMNLLPSRKDLNLDDAKLVGVGGTLRALARYEQKLVGYPLDKTHNYKIGRKSLGSAVNRLMKLSSDDISRISVIGASRAETIVAGSCVIRTLMDKYDFSNMYVSNHGLREGILSMFLENPKAYNYGNPTTEQIKATIRIMEPRKTNHEKESFLDSLSTMRLLSKKERRIFDYAEKAIVSKYSLSNPQSMFYSIMDEDLPLAHDDHLILGMVLAHIRHPKTSDWLFTRYKTILSQQDKASIKKISVLVTLRKILERTKSKVELKLHGNKILEIIVGLSRSNHTFLLQDALKKFETAFDVKVILSVRHYQGNSQNSILEL
ncbi:MAG: Ppx/GppA phosphatase family protein [Nitrososphaera sp.]